MPIRQVNIWVCEVCGHESSTVTATEPYSDPVVTPPEGEEWPYIIQNGRELLACPSCQNSALNESRESEFQRCLEE